MKESLSCIILANSQSWASTPSAVEKIKSRGVLLWGCDAEGGAPMAFPDPKEPSRIIGFEVDIALANYLDQSEKFGWNNAGGNNCKDFFFC